MIHKTADDSRSIRIAEWCSIIAVFLAVVMPRASTIWILGLIICFGFHRRHAWQPMLWPFLALGIWSMISTMIQIEYKDRWSSHDFMFLYNWLPLLLVPALPWAEIKRREWMLRLLFIGTCIAGFIVLLQGFWNFNFYRDTSFNWSKPNSGAFFTGSRPNGTWEHPLKFGAMLTVTCLALCSWRPKSFVIPTTLIWIISLFINKTRLAIGGFLLIAPLIYIKKWSIKKVVLAGLVGLALIGITGVLVYQNNAFKNRIDRALNLEDGRIAIWKLSWSNFKNEPLVGYGGIRGARKAFHLNADPKQELAHKGTHAHNNILAIACSYGLVGLALWLIAHSWLLTYCWKLDCRTAVVVLLSYHAMGMLEDTAEERFLTCLCMFIVAADIAWQLHQQGDNKSNPYDSLQGHSQDKELPKSV